MVMTIDVARARAHWFETQGLRGPIAGRPSDVIARTGWLRTIGGADVYLAMRSRCAPFARADLDAAVAAGRVRVSPAVRGCIYLVDDGDRPVALRIADLLSRRRVARDLAKVGVEPAEVVAIGDAALSALTGSPLTTAQIRKALPTGTVRSLGDAGKKVGLSSALPVALRTLEFAGRIERRPIDDRLDHERYVWSVPAEPVALDGLPDDIDGMAPLIAARFFRFAGPATLDAFVKWSGLNKGQSKKAIAAAGLQPITVEGYGDAWADPAALDALARPAAPIEPRIALLNFADNYLTVRERAAVFVDPAHGDKIANSWGRKLLPMRDAGYLHTRAIVRGDMLIGSWEWDPDANAVIAIPFGRLSTAEARELDAAAADLTGFLTDEIGHARSTSIDSPKSMRKRVALVRGQGA